MERPFEWKWKLQPLGVQTDAGSFGDLFVGLPFN